MPIEVTARLFAEAMVNAMWQGLLIAAGIEAATSLLWGRLARLRYGLWCAGFAAIVTLPVLHALSRTGNERRSPAGEPDGGIAAAVASAAEYAQRDEWWSLGEAYAGGIAAVFLLAGLVGMVRVLLLVGSLPRLLRLKRESAPLPPGLEAALADILRNHGRRNVRIRLSRGISTPSTLGFLRPDVLLPQHLLPVLKEEEWSQVVLHELAHIRRYDDWFILGQRALERLLFYLPAVRWAGRRMDLQREMACDDFAAERCGSELAYARCLMRVAEQSRWSSPSLAPGAVAGKRALSRRVASLLAPTAATHRWDPGREMLAAMVVALPALGIHALPHIGFAGGVGSMTEATSDALHEAQPSPRHELVEVDPPGAAPAPDSGAAGGALRVPDRDQSALMTDAAELAPELEPRVVEFCFRCGGGNPVPPIASLRRVEPRGIERVEEGSRSVGRSSAGPLPPTSGGWSAASAPVQVTVSLGRSAPATRGPALQLGAPPRAGQMGLPSWLQVTVRPASGADWGRIAR